jgi:tetratricopeptide (TPR) repeat protein
VLRSPLRYLLGAVIGPVVLLGVGFVAVGGPWSPFALDRANELYTEGELAAARAAYAEIAEGWHFPGTRAEAALRAGLLAGQAGDQELATNWLRRTIDLAPDADLRARTWLAMADLYRVSDPGKAAELCARAAAENGDPHYLVEGARLWERGGDPGRALALWRQAEPGLAAEDASQLAEARLATRRLEASLDGSADAEE